MSVGFTIQFAIRTPSGRLYAQPGEKQTIEDYDGIGWYRDMMNMFGVMVISGEYPTSGEPPVSQPKPLIFDKREDAEKKLTELCEQAARVGVDYYGGAVVSRLCSPFTDSPAPQQFAERVADWLESQNHE
jgi:hypothetical protein